MASKNPHSDDSELLQRIERVKEELSCARRELDRKDQIIAGLQKLLFGKKSERYDPNQHQLEFGEDVLGKPEPEESGEQKEDEAEPTIPRPKQTRRKKGDLFPKNIAVKVVARIKPDEVKADPENYTKIGEEYHDELEVKKSELHYRRTVLEKYKMKGQRDKAPIIPPAPQPSIPGTMCGPELIAMIIADKFCDHLPQYRQADRFLRRHGVILCRQTINKWTHYSARYLEVIGEAIKKEIAKAAVLQVDAPERSGDDCQRQPEGGAKRIKRRCFTSIRELVRVSVVTCGITGIWKPAPYTAIGNWDGATSACLIC